MGTTDSFPEDPASSTGVPSTHSGGSSSGNIIHVVHNHPASRHGSRPRSNSNRSLVELNGVLLGLPRSGKRTLLDRLQGRDPFADLEASDTIRTDTPGKQLNITVPYMPPSNINNIKNKNIHNDRIQLRIQASQIPHFIMSNNKNATKRNSNDNDKSDEDGIDFGVILLDPRQRPEANREYLGLVLQSLVQHALRQNKDDDDGKDDNGLENQETDLRHRVFRPVCVCILLNFRDAKDQHCEQQKQQQRGQDQQPWITETHVRGWTMEYIQQQVQQQQQQHGKDANASHNPTSVQQLLQASKLVLTCASTSLTNCFGLERLHGFIYQAYLQRKQWEAERQLAEIHRAQLAYQHLLLEQQQHVSYKEFVRVSQGKQPKQERRRRRQHRHNKSSGSSNDSHSNQDERILRGTPDDHNADTVEADPSQHRRRRIVHNSVSTENESKGRKNSSRPAPPLSFSQAQTKEDLESFLASSDDEDNDEGESRVLMNRDCKGTEDTLDEDSDSDDFVVDAAADTNTDRIENERSINTETKDVESKTAVVTAAAASAQSNAAAAASDRRTANTSHTVDGDDSNSSNNDGSYKSTLTTPVEETRHLEARPQDNGSTKDDDDSDSGNHDSSNSGLSKPVSEAKGEADVCSCDGDDVPMTGDSTEEQSDTGAVATIATPSSAPDEKISASISSAASADQEEGEVKDTVDNPGIVLNSSNLGSFLDDDASDDDGYRGNSGSTVSGTIGDHRSHTKVTDDDDDDDFVIATSDEAVSSATKTAPSKVTAVDSPSNTSSPKASNPGLSAAAKAALDAATKQAQSMLQTSSQSPSTDTANLNLKPKKKKKKDQDPDRKQKKRDKKAKKKLEEVT